MGKPTTPHLGTTPHARKRNGDNATHSGRNTCGRRQAVGTPAAAGNRAPRGAAALSPTTYHRRVTLRPPIRSIGVLGAGRVGRALGKLARDVSLDVTVASSDDQQGISAATSADAVILAIPLGKYRTLPTEALTGSLVIDAMNYWWELDGRLPEFEDARTSSSQVVAAFLPGANVVKAFNHASVWELENLAAPPGAPQRRALAVAGNDADDVAAVSKLVDAMGFDPVPAGSLEEGVRFEPNTEAFGADANKADLQKMLDEFWESQRGRVVARARAHKPTGMPQPPGSLA